MSHFIQYIPAMYSKYAIIFNALPFTDMAVSCENMSTLSEFAVTCLDTF